MISAVTRPGAVGTRDGSRRQNTGGAHLSLTILPPELLSLIVEAAAAGQSKCDVNRLLRSCRKVYLTGYEILFRNLVLDNPLRVSETLRTLDFPPTRIDKLSFVRSLSISPRMPWKQSNVEALVKCLRKVPELRSLKFAAGGCKYLTVLWGIVNSLQKLDELSFRLEKDAPDAFKEATPFPSSIRVLRLDAGRCLPEFMAGFLRMVDSRAPNLVDVFLEGFCRQASLMREWNLAAYRRFRGKIREPYESGPDAIFLPENIVQLELAAVNYHQPAISAVLACPWEKLKSLERLMVSGPKTADLLHLVGYLPKLKAIEITDPDFTLRADQFENAAAAIVRPGVKTVIKLTWAGYKSAEKTLWRTNSDITFINGEKSRSR